MSIRGCDISGWQPGHVDLTGMDFTYVKATQGLWKINANHDAQVAEARDLGLIVGHYHFPAWGDPVAEARAFVAASNWVPGDFMVLDIENSPITPWPADPVSWCVAFELEVYRLLGIWCMDYDGPNVRAGWDWGPLAALGGGLISPEYNNVGPSDPSPWTNVAMWQNADTNISGGDSDVFFGDRAALTAYGTPGAVTLSGTITPITPPAEEPDMKAILATDGTSPDVWIGDGITRRKIATLDTLNAITYLKDLFGLDPTVQTIPDLWTLGYPIDTGIETNAAGVPLAVLQARFQTKAGTEYEVGQALGLLLTTPAQTVTNNVAALSGTDLAALAKAVNDEADARERARLGA